GQRARARLGQAAAGPAEGAADGQRVVADGDVGVGAGRQRHGAGAHVQILGRAGVGDGGAPVLRVVGERNSAGGGVVDCSAGEVERAGADGAGDTEIQVAGAEGGRAVARGAGGVEIQRAAVDGDSARAQRTGGVRVDGAIGDGGAAGVGVGGAEGQTAAA